MRLTHTALPFLFTLLAFILASLLGAAAAFSQTFAGGTGTAESPFQISTLDHPNTIMGDFLDDHFILVNNLDFAGSIWGSDATVSGYVPEGSVPIGQDSTAKFTGSFDGDGTTGEVMVTVLAVGTTVLTIGRDGDATYSSVVVEQELEMQVGPPDFGAQTIADQTYTEELTYRVFDSMGRIATLPFTITVLANTPPDFAGATIADQTYTENTVITDLVLPVATDTGTVTYSLAPVPAGLAFDPNTRTLSGTPTTPQAVTEYSYTATDNATSPLTTTLIVMITVLADTIAPDFAGATISDQTYIVNTVITDLVLPVAFDTGTVTYSLSPALPSGLTTAGGVTDVDSPPTISGTPDATSATVTYTYTAKDNAATPNTQTLTFMITVSAAAQCDTAGAIFGGGMGTELAPYQICSIDQLNRIRNNSGGENYLEDHFVLKKNLDFEDVDGDGSGTEYNYDDGDEGWLPIGSDTPFTGSFDGDDNVIRNLRIDREGENDVGLFGGVGSGGSIVSLGLEDLEVAGATNVGGLVGGLSGDGTVTDSYATGSVTGRYSNVGGLAGLINASTVMASYATGTVAGTSNVGGLAGLINAGTVTDSYATGTVAGASDVGGLVGRTGFGGVTRSYATGSVTGGSRVGGLVGSNGFGMVTSSYWNTELSGNADSDGGIPLTTAQMYDQGNFAGFDFDDDDGTDEVTDVWLPPMDGEHFPHLREVSKNGQVLSIPRIKVILGLGPFSLVPTFFPPTITEAPVFSGDDDTVATIDPSSGEIMLGSGAARGDEVTITVRRGGDSIYSSVTGSRVLQVTMAQTITISDGSTLSKAFGDLPFTLSAVATSGLSAFTWVSSNSGVVTVTGESTATVTVTLVGLGMTTLTVQEPGDEDWEPGEASVTLTVTKGTQTPSGGMPLSKAFGDLPFTLTAIADTKSGLSAFEWESSDTGVATVPGGPMATVTVTLEGEGMTTLTAREPGNENWEEGITEWMLTVTKGTQTPSGGMPLSKAFGDSEFMLTAVADATSGLSAFEWLSSDTGVATVPGGAMETATVTLVGVGTTTLTAREPGDSNWEEGMTEWMLMVSKGAPQISGFPESREVPLVPATFALGGTSSSGVPVTYSVPSTDVITISGGMATITGSGTVVVTATVSATANWEGVTQQQTLTVADKMGQTLTFAPLPDKRFGDSPFLLSASSSEPSLASSITFSSSDESVATVADSTVTVVGSGMTDITATQAGSAEFVAASVVQTLTVTKGTQAPLGGEPLTKAFGDSEFMLTAVADVTSGLSAFEWVSSDTGVATVPAGPMAMVTVTLEGVGMTTLAAREPGDSNWEEGMTEWTLMVLKGTPQISGFPESREVPLVPATFALGGTSSSGETIMYSVPNTDVITISGDMATITGSGIVVVTATVLATANWEGVTQRQTLTVADKMGQTLTFAPLPDKRFGDSPFLLSASSSEPSLTSSITFSSSEESVATVAGFTVTVVGSGMTDITATQAGNAEFVAASVVQTLTVTQGTQTPSGGMPLSKTFGDSEFMLTAVADVTSGLSAFEWVSSDTGVATVPVGAMATVTVTLEGAGMTTLTAREPGDSNWEEGMTEWTLMVLKGTPQISGFPESREVPLVPATFALGGASSSGAAILYEVPNADVITISGDMATITGSGIVVVTATVLATANWEGVTQQQTLMVSDKMGQTLTFAPLPDKRVGDSPFPLSATSSESSLTSSITFSSSDESVATVAGFTVTLVGSGMTDITATQVGSAEFVMASVVQTLRVFPSVLTFGLQMILSRNYLQGTLITPLPLPEATGGTEPYTYTLDPVPAGLSFDDDPASRTLSGTPDATQALTGHTYTVTDTGSPAQTATLTFTTTVLEAGTLTFMSPVEAQTYTKDVEIEPLTLPEAIGGMGPYTYTLDPVPAGLSFDDDPASRTLSGTPDATQAMTEHTYTVTDSTPVTALTATLTFTITVIEALTFMPPRVEAQTYTQDVAIEPLTLPEAMGGMGPYMYTLAPVPAGLSFDDDPASRTLSGTPDATQALTEHTYTVTDSTIGTSLTFTITVIEALGIGSQEAAVHVYPNPASDVLHIEFPGADEYGIMLLTLTGKPVFGGWHAGGGSRTLDVSTLKRGVYFLKIEDSEGVLHIFRIIR